ncbi:MAG: hypothetical protein IJC94_07810 [Oscillospiraceae bacterium]|nr:hypothetical protein [Oscillospiraceae bacterium]
MEQALPLKINISGFNTGHIQGIALDAERKYLYHSFTTCLVKTDLHGNIIGSVTGLAGHLGCIAYNPDDRKVYGSLEFKHDSIGSSILAKIGRSDDVWDGFYIVSFDVDKIDRPNMDAEKDGIMTAVFLKEVYNDFITEGHRYGCSGIDGVTFAPAFGENGGKSYLYVAYGIYGDLSRSDNDHQIILKYDISHWDRFAAPLDQTSMHRLGPDAPDAKYFLYTGNTTYGIQNLEYDPFSDTVLAAVYCGKKPQFPNYSLFFIDRTAAPERAELFGIGQIGQRISLAALGEKNAVSGICGSRFPYGATGMISLGDGRFYFSEDFCDENGYGSNICLYSFDKATAEFKKL